MQKGNVKHMKKKFEGIFPALLTPFDESDHINVPVLEQLVEYNLRKGVNGFYVGGSTAEAFLLTEEERLLVMKTVSEKAKGKCTLIAHIGCISTSQAIRLAKAAKELSTTTTNAAVPSGA